MRSTIAERESLQTRRGLIENRFQQTETQRHRQNPQLLQQQSLGALQFVQVNPQGIGVPHRAAGGKVSRRNCDGARLVLVIVRHRVRQTAQLAANRAQLVEHRARHARIFANFQQRLRPRPALPGQRIEILKERLQTPVDGLHTLVEGAEVPGAMDGAPAMRVFAGRGAELIRHQTRVPQTLLVDHRHLTRHTHYSTRR